MDISEVENVIKEDIAANVSAVKSVVDDGGKFFLRITGNSMNPFLENEKDIAVLSAPSDLKVNDVAFYVRQSGGVVLHRIVAVHGLYYDMCGDNQIDVEKGIPKGSVVAVMREYIKDGKLCSCDCFSYKVKSVFWVKTRIFRKFYRKLKIKIKNLVK